MIACGWCGKPTPDAPRCAACGHADPPQPWVQRNEPVPLLEPHDGRPPMDAAEIRRRLASGGTDQQIADRFEVDPRTVRRWRQKVSA